MEKTTTNKTSWHLQIWNTQKIGITGHFADYRSYPTLAAAEKEAKEFTASCRILEVVYCTTFWRHKESICTN